MLVRSTIFGQMAGSLASATAQRQRTGIVLRARVTPVDPATQQQLAVRTGVSDLVNFWNDVLTEAQRLAWNDYALNTPLTNKIGDSFVTSGIAHYVRSNVPRIQADDTLIPRIDDAPSIFNLGDPMSGIDLTATTISAGDQEFDTAWLNDENNWQDDPANVLLIYLGRPQNPGVNFFKGPFRFAGVVPGNATTAPTQFTVDPTPFVYSAGQKVWFRTRISRGDGRLSPPNIWGPVIVGA